MVNIPLPPAQGLQIAVVTATKMGRNSHDALSVGRSRQDRRENPNEPSGTEYRTNPRPAGLPAFQLASAQTNPRRGSTLGLEQAHEVVRRHADVRQDRADQRDGEVAALVVRYGGRAAVRVPVEDVAAFWRTRAMPSFLSTRSITRGSTGVRRATQATSICCTSTNLGGRARSSSCSSRQSSSTS
jgi:hypothetical protein